MVNGFAQGTTLYIDDSNDNIVIPMDDIVFNGVAGATNNLYFAGPQPTNTLPSNANPGPVGFDAKFSPTAIISITASNVGTIGPAPAGSGNANPQVLPLDSESDDEEDDVPTSLEDLANEINTILSQTPGVEGIEAKVVNNAIAFTDTQSGDDADLQIMVESDDPAATQLGFQNDETDDGHQQSFFIQNLAVTGNLTLAANDITATAQVGALGITLGQGTASGTVSVALNVVGPDGSSKFDPTKDISDLTINPTITGSVNLDLEHISVNAGFLSTPAGANPSIQISIPDFINDPSNIQVNTQDLGDLINFQNLSLGQIIAGIDQLANSLSQNSHFSFLNDKLPLINQSVDSLLNYATALTNIDSQVDGAGPAPAAPDHPPERGEQRLRGPWLADQQQRRDRHLRCGGRGRQDSPAAWLRLQQ